jgi:beta-lactamase regulating signal transducer with metallopeptidase domain
MDAVFLKLLNMSITASWLILAVLILRLLLKKAPKWVLCVLWAMIAIRLIYPFSIESTLSLVPSAETISVETTWFSPIPDINSGIPVINNTVNPIIRGAFKPESGASVNPLQIYLYVAGIIWASGVLAMMCYAMLSYVRLKKRVSEATQLRDNIWLCDEVKSPFILGIVRPRVYLSSSIDEAQMKHVISHETAHLRRKDHWWKPLGFALLTVYWFNPLVWVAYILLCRDIELACDEKVIRAYSKDGKRAYSEALLSCSESRKMIVACPLAFGEIGVKERVKSVLNYKKPAFWIIFIAVAACIAFAVFFLTNPTPHSKEDNGLKYYLTIAADNVASIQVSTPYKSGGGQHADGSLYEKGEKVYLESLDGLTDLSGVTVTALDKKGNVIYALSVPEGAGGAMNSAFAFASHGWLLASTDPEEATSNINNAMVITSAEFDIDNDGTKESCMLSYGPTSGVFSFVFSVTHDGVEKYRNTFITHHGNLEFLEKDGSTVLRHTYQEFANSAEETHDYDISVNEGHIILSENGDRIPYLG